MAWSQTLKVTMVTQEVHCVDKCMHFPDDICSFPFQRSFSSLSRPVQDLCTCGDNRGSTNTCSLLESFREQLITKKKKDIQNQATLEESKLFHGNYLLCYNSVWSPLKWYQISLFFFPFSWLYMYDSHLLPSQVPTPKWPTGQWAYLRKKHAMFFSCE